MKTNQPARLQDFNTFAAAAPGAALHPSRARITPSRVVPVALALCAAAILSSGCAMPVPGTRIKGQIGGVPFELHSPKQATLRGLMIQHHAGTNTFVLNVAELSSINDPQVIDKSYAGQAAVAKTYLDGINQLGEKLAEGLAKGAAKGVTP